MDKRLDGQEHPGSVVARVLAQRLRKAMEKGELSEREFGVALQSAQAEIQKVSAAVAAGGNGSVQSGVEVKLRMGWRRGEEIQWSPEESTHALPMAFGRNPGPTGLKNTELILLDENPPPATCSIAIFNSGAGRVDRAEG